MPTGPDFAGWEYPLANTMPGKHDDGGDLYSGSDTDNFDTEFDRLTAPQLDHLLTVIVDGRTLDGRTAAGGEARWWSN